MNVKSIVIAVASVVCGVAGTLATVLPSGEVKQGAAAVAYVCEASGFPAYLSAADAGTPASR